MGLHHQGVLLEIADLEILIDQLLSGPVWNVRASRVFRALPHQRLHLHKAVTDTWLEDLWNRACYRDVKCTMGQLV